MQSDLLLHTIKSTLHKTKVDELANLVSAGGFNVIDLIDLSFHADEQIGFRAAWILENVCCNDLLLFLPDIHYFLKRFPHQNNLSARRHYTKIIALLTKKKAPIAIQQIIAVYPTDELVETVFSWLIDEEVPVATKSHCLDILANLNGKHPWIKEELIETMDFLVDKESIAFYAKVKKIRRIFA
jgi:hypothetical protein